MKESCETCRHYREKEDRLDREEDGECIKYPPPAELWKVVMVSKTHYCGEHASLNPRCGNCVFLESEEGHFGAGSCKRDPIPPTQNKGPWRFPWKIVSSSCINYLSKQDDS